LVYVDLPSALFISFATNNAGSFITSFQIPNIPALAGYSVVAQAAIILPPGGMQLVQMSDVKIANIGY